MRKVNFAELHAGWFLPGLGSIKPTLPPGDKSWKCEMFEGDKGLLIKFTGSAIPNTECMVPWASVKAIRYQPE